MSHTLLLVDDEDDIREVAQLSLAMTAGWEVHTASSGARALAAARALKPEAILMDVMMPDMDGPTTVRHLKADPETAGIPVILLTAKVQASDRAAFEDLGVVGVLAKPFDPMALADEVAAVLGW
ncbi:response regulator [Longimicrobium sp.]|jgi:CheY-like chemotaxis protein|uniref:response regulator n=1 Tax=Longimicrobium sp. TaxID=2029185 RepID=UPI002F9529E2